MDSVSEDLRTFGYWTVIVDMKIRNYQDLTVWQKSMDLAEGIYRASRAFPASEVYGLSSQVRKAAVSIASNVAEGQGRRSTGDYQRFLSIAQGSLSELETQVLLAKRLQYLKEPESERLLELSSQVGRMIHGLRKSLENHKRKTLTPES